MQDIWPLGEKIQNKGKNNEKGGRKAEENNIKDGKKALKMHLIG